MLTGFISLVEALTAKMSLRDESGQALVEYGLIIAVVAVACIVGLTALAGGLNGLFNSVVGSL